ncbi:SDR family oxidoreductase [Saccharopolyspora sp. K220]|uniref:SDR family oxidoreductase n=1 Tax=Saccharopolyspora soli TaxID=2926618 RepID=UPI001F594A0E|nr:SDR family oxidoreductase [Saccharopolyspora soli]MCI2424270.1 SDR family oxidoreductase [Saccharopolyspora soli]
MTNPSSWLVTGASAGIGRAVTRHLLAQGHRVAAPVRAPQRLADLADAYPDLLWTTELDLLDTGRLRKVVEEAFTAFGRIDVVLSNAGRGAFGAAEELSDEAVDEQIALNMTAPIQLLRAALPHLRGQGGGRFIQTSTMGGQISSPGGSMYHASKWGVEGFLESVIPEVAPFGIGITMIEPGNIRTGFGAALSISPALDAYAKTPVGQVRQFIEKSGGNLTGSAPGDPVKVAAAIIDTATQEPAPRRVALGSDAYDAIRSSLTGRLAELDAGHQVALSTDFAS